MIAEVFFNWKHDGKPAFRNWEAIALTPLPPASPVLSVPTMGAVLELNQLQIRVQKWILQVVLMSLVSAGRGLPLVSDRIQIISASAQYQKMSYSLGMNKHRSHHQPDHQNPHQERTHTR